MSNNENESLESQSQVVSDSQSFQSLATNVTESTGEQIESRVQRNYGSSDSSTSQTIQSTWEQAKAEAQHWTKVGQEKITSASQQAKNSAQRVYQETKVPNSQWAKWLILSIIILGLILLQIFFGKWIMAFFAYLGELLLVIVQYSPWPVVVLIFGFYFRDEIRAMINRINH